MGRSWARGSAARVATAVVSVTVAVVVAVVGSAVAPPWAAAQERSEILGVEVSATVRPDGSMEVVELLTYDFTEERNGGFRTFDLRPGELIQDFGVREDGERRDLAPGFANPNAPSGVRWFGSADHSKVTGRHVYELRYRVEGAVDLHADAAELYWQFIGEDFPQLGFVAVDVTLPPGTDGYQAFAHGPLHGLIEADGNVVRLRVVNNPPFQFVEGRILMPVEAFDGPPGAQPARDRILAEEARNATAANAQRERALEAIALQLQVEATLAERQLTGDCDGADGELGRRCDELAPLAEAARRRADRELTLADVDLLADLVVAGDAVEAEVRRLADERDERTGNALGAGAAAVAAVGFVAVHRRWGKEPPQPADVGEYWRDVPEEPPAIVAAIDTWGRVDAGTVFAATTIDLAQRGLLTITVEGGEHRFTLGEAAEGQELYTYETHVLHRLFRDGRTTITRSALLGEARLDRAEAASWMRSLRRKVLDHFATYGFVSTSKVPFLLHGVLVVAAVVTGVVALGKGAWLGAGLALAVGVALVAATPLLRRRTPAGHRRHAEIEAFKRFLRHFSLVEDVPVGHLALYERYLVYAVALGVAAELQKGLRLKFPELAEPDSGFAPWYAAAMLDDGASDARPAVDRFVGFASLASFATDLSSSSRAAFSPPARASGVSSGGGSDWGGSDFSSGGFSGGGGDGGGGGGAGSW